MSTTKRASLPGASEFFRSTNLQETKPDLSPQPSAPQPAVIGPVSTQRQVDRSPKTHVPKQGSGRQRHEEKVTFYCTRDELLALERARLALRESGASADRGRIVREAISYMLADLEANGAASILADRLSRRR